MRVEGAELMWVGSPNLGLSIRVGWLGEGAGWVAVLAGGGRRCVRAHGERRVVRWAENALGSLAGPQPGGASAGCFT